MKAAIIQPYFSTDYNDSEAVTKWECDMMDSCDESTDIIVLPEYSDAQVLTKSKEDYFALVEKYNKTVLEKAAETAKRCGAMVFINAMCLTETGYRNTTYAFDRSGACRGHYFKQHLVNSEMYKRELDKEYTFEYSEPYILEMEGFRFAFLTCYDFYFYEMYPNIARQNVDFVIGCSHQRSDRHEALEIITRFLAYHTNAYVLRSSVSMGEDTDIGGCSMVVSPRGDMLINMKSRIGMETVELDPNEKYYKPAGYGNPPAAHYEYIEDGRRPWKYRPSGSAIVRYDSIMPYPRRCAVGYTGLGRASMAAYGAAVACGAEEIGIEVCFDSGLPVFGEDRTPLENAMKQFSCHAVMNIILKECDSEGLKKIKALIHKYDCGRHVYITLPSFEQLSEMKEIMPKICAAVCVKNEEDIEKASERGASKVLICGDNAERLIFKAHENGMKVIVYGSGSADRYLALGADAIVTEEYK